MKDKMQQAKLIFSLVLILLAVIFVVLNTNQVAISFGFFDVKLPLIIVLVVMIIIGVLIGWFWGSNKGNHDKKS
ncbi:lipopolysaccharide assembly protein LapA domain-containing protein [Lactobacillus sp. ESL0731]|uniref:lipopolysaccharide assembly protein LapA domain-containing protein n=1 Tax=unclassified Lactobacillus TaxID=2620435 RepID=UPI0023F8F1C3|nr:MULTISPECIES: lipopolysaccharide assembly protein LapA domain-containing protein [unclassified Lactobacillus]WEV51971.1 lipopolysaccharide assembly protein LapA domain-containing protein [Lactobacillus sp. ESL0700]WEV63102.1 lipopolysaccharide assembly protein LapA domain-containing protein [Lactobacillus sp. ESL0731]